MSPGPTQARYPLRRADTGAEEPHVVVDLVHVAGLHRRQPLPQRPAEHRGAVGVGRVAVRPHDDHVAGRLVDLLGRDEHVELLDVLHRRTGDAGVLEDRADEAVLA